MDNQITYLSNPTTVSMGEKYYDIANENHFWIRRRFDVFRKLSAGLGRSDTKIAEVGCGHGLVQKQFEEYFGLSVEGFDLNERALKNSVAPDHKLYYYDVNERQTSFQGRYDQVILFDVIEHVADPHAFLESVVYMVKPGGVIAINVPALQSLFSGYDLIAGHYHRYNMKTMLALISAQQLHVETVTYWGATLVPILVVRKLLFMFRQLNETTYRQGFSPLNGFFNNLLYAWSGLEKIPQRVAGTSLMAITRCK